MVNDESLNVRKKPGISFKVNYVLLVFLIVSTVNFGLLRTVAFSAPDSSPVIALEEFRWTSFPLNVYVDMNSWTVPDYAVAVREALDDWVRSIWNYTQAYNASLPVINYAFYVSNVNATDHYDVVFTFTPDKMPPTSNTVGLTTYNWNPITHTPLAPITINVTTSSGKAENLFVKNVAMHEFGHALGLGHAYSSNTLNGPELMYYTSSNSEIVYPSTLDIYALTNLYDNKFSQNVQLPSNIPFEMLAEGTIPPSGVTSLWDNYQQYLPLVGVFILIVVAAIVLGRLAKENRHEEIPEAPPPPTIDESNVPNPCRSN